MELTNYMNATEIISIKGKYVLIFREATELFLKNKFRNKLIADLFYKFLKYLNLEYRFATKYIPAKRIYEYDNVICTVGKSAIAAQLANAETYALSITYVAVGTGAGTPAAGDTVLFTELARVANSVDYSASNVATIQGFFNSATGNGVLTEMGAFGDGSASQASASADTGILFSHVAISETKTVAETLTCQFTITIT